MLKKDKETSEINNVTYYSFESFQESFLRIANLLINKDKEFEQDTEVKVTFSTVELKIEKLKFQ